LIPTDEWAAPFTPIGETANASAPRGVFASTQNL
jgi:hypothetical protein